MGLCQDDCGNPCVYVKNHKEEYLSCHEDGKHVFWHDVEDDDAWTWEMWYPEYTESGVFLKSYHESYMISDEDGMMWQTDEHCDVYFEMNKSQYDKMMNGDDAEEEDSTNSESDKEDPEEPEPEPDNKKANKSDTSGSDDEKPKRTIDPEVQKKAAIARKLKSYIESECKSEFEGLKGKEKTAKKTELYKKHKKENSDLYKKLYKKAEKEV